MFYDMPLQAVCSRWWVAQAALKLATIPTLRLRPAGKLQIKINSRVGKTSFSELSPTIGLPNFYDVPFQTVCSRWWVSQAALELATIPTLRLRPAGKLQIKIKSRVGKTSFSELSPTIGLPNFYDVPFQTVCSRWWVSQAALKLATIPTLRLRSASKLQIKSKSRVGKTSFSELSPTIGLPNFYDVPFQTVCSRWWVTQAALELVTNYTHPTATACRQAANQE